MHNGGLDTTLSWTNNPRSQSLCCHLPSWVLQHEVALKKYPEVLICSYAAVHMALFRPWYASVSSANLLPDLRFWLLPLKLYMAWRPGYLQDYLLIVMSIWSIRGKAGNADGPLSKTLHLAGPRRKRFSFVAPSYEHHLHGDKSGPPFDTLLQEPEDLALPTAQNGMEPIRISILCLFAWLLSFTKGMGVGGSTACYFSYIGLLSPKHAYHICIPNLQTFFAYLYILSIW